MILADTSVWVDLLNARRGASLSRDNLLRLVTCGPVVQEVVQGLRPGPAGDEFREVLLALPRLSDPLSLETFLEAAEIYRQGRRKGYTVRSSTDCLIAAIAIENRVPVWHKDRDYAIIARYTRLEAVAQPFLV